jgi:hypothetical protein
MSASRVRVRPTESGCVLNTIFAGLTVRAQSAYPFFLRRPSRPDLPC